MLLLLCPDGVIWRGDGRAPDTHGGGGAGVYRGGGQLLHLRSGRVAEQSVAVHGRVPGVGNVETALAWEGEVAAIVAGEHIRCLVTRPHDAAICPGIATHCQGNVATKLALECVIAVRKTETIAITFLDGSSLQVAIIII